MHIRDITPPERLQKYNDVLTETNLVQYFRPMNYLPEPTTDYSSSRLKTLPVYHLLQIK